MNFEGNQVKAPYRILSQNQLLKSNIDYDKGIEESYR